MWQLRARWASTLMYQTIRDGITDYLLPASSTWKIKNMRRRFNADAKVVSPEHSYHQLEGDQKQEEEEMRPTSCYQCLPSQDLIRLLHLFPGPDGSPIEAVLSTHSITNLPAYEGLSYCWGSKRGFRMQINSRSMMIQRSLFHALSALRRRDVERVLWVDALCINQNDDGEKSSQVQLMRVIYQYCTRVVVWLGENSEGSDLAIDLLLSIQRLALEDEEKEGICPSALAPDDLPKLGLPLVYSGQWEALEAIFWRPWFTRIWIIQVWKPNLPIPSQLHNPLFKVTPLSTAATRSVIEIIH
jgi:hypothetical protein